MGKIRAYFNTCRALEATEVSYFVIILYMVKVSRRKIVPNCLQTRCNVSKQHHVVFHRLYIVILLLFISQKFPVKNKQTKKKQTNSYNKGRHSYANIMFGLPVLVSCRYSISVIDFSGIIKKIVSNTILFTIAGFHCHAAEK